MAAISLDFSKPMIFYSIYGDKRDLILDLLASGKLCINYNRIPVDEINLSYFKDNLKMDYTFEISKANAHIVFMTRRDFQNILDDSQVLINFIYNQFDYFAFFDESNINEFVVYPADVSKQLLLDIVSARIDKCY